MQKEAESGCCHCHRWKHCVQWVFKGGKVGGGHSCNNQVELFILLNTSSLVSDNTLIFQDP